MLLWPIFCIALAAVLATPRLRHSLWSDEQVTLINWVGGGFVRDLEPEAVSSGEIRLPVWEKPSWAQTIWGYQSTNQHFLCSILARASLDTWRATTGRESWEFHEFTLRILPFLAGLGGIFAWWSLGRRVAGLPTAMILTALLAIHPWVLRLITEMRGYAYVFLFFPLLLIAVMACWSNSRWRDWAWFSLLQFLTLYSWPGMAPTVVCLNLGLATVFALTLKSDRTASLVRLKRWVLANLVTVSVLAILVVPAIPQILPFLEEHSPRKPMDTHWLPYVFAHFFGGMEWTNWKNYASQNPYFQTVESLLPKYAWFLVPCMIAFCLLTIAGWIHFLRRNRGVCLFVSAISFIPVLLMVGIAFSTEIFIFAWYFFHLLPLLLLCTSAGVWLIGSRFPNWSRPLIAGLWVIAMFAAGWPKLNAIRTRSTGPLRESVVAIRGSIIDPRDLAQKSIMVAHLRGAAMAYDPLGWMLSTDHVTGPESEHFLGLVQLMSLADRQGAELYVIGGLKVDDRHDVPEVMRWLDDENAFEHFKTVHGTEAQNLRELYHYKGGFFDSLR